MELSLSAEHTACGIEFCLWKEGTACFLVEGAGMGMREGGAHLRSRQQVSLGLQVIWDVV